MHTAPRRASFHSQPPAIDARRQRRRHDARLPPAAADAEASARHVRGVHDLDAYREIEFCHTNALLSGNAWHNAAPTIWFISIGWSGRKSVWLRRAAATAGDSKSPKLSIATRDLGHDVQIAQALESTGARHARHLTPPSQRPSPFPINAFAQELRTGVPPCDGRCTISSRASRFLSNRISNVERLPALQADLMIVASKCAGNQSWNAPSCQGRMVVTHE